MRNKALEIPGCITILRDDDGERQVILERDRMPFLINGYRVEKYEDSPPYKYLSYVNCDHSKFISTLQSVISLVPEPMGLSVGDYSEMIDIGNSYSLKCISNVIDDNSVILSDNCDIQMSIYHFDKHPAIQLNITDCKFFEIFSEEISDIHELLSSIGIKQNEKLATIDEFPRTMSGSTEHEIQNIVNAIKLSIGCCEDKTANN